ncbi:MAG: tRNA (guanosine(37)-N1)-methyltransferase TrmD [Deltaproteobacteria bacterium RBG_13_52_11]|nr:MAG: tRNA (guanosine(37)-N1)-methyltransferase TrmD [Deltaproteobacteria bacterium RBG_13_52_11]
MIFDILTLFPEMFLSPLEESILGKACEEGLITVNLINIRDYAEGRHRVTDDYPYGGGKGMIMKPEPIIRGIKAIRSQHTETRVILMTPQGSPLRQEVAKRLAQLSRICLVCGRYEGVDERVRDFVHEEISIGDYVLTGGEVAALVVIDAIARLIPGVLGDKGSSEEDSFSQGLLEYPQYTRPREFEGRKVPEVLLSGDHQTIEQWRRREALRRTWERRPDLLAKTELSKEDQELFDELKGSSGTR